MRSRCARCLRSRAHSGSADLGQNPAYRPSPTAFHRNESVGSFEMYEAADPDLSGPKQLHIRRYKKYPSSPDFPPARRDPEPSDLQHPPDPWRETGPLDVWVTPRPPRITGTLDLHPPLDGSENLDRRHETDSN